MKIGSWKVATIAAYDAGPPEVAGVLSAEVDLGDVFDALIIRIPTITAASISVKVAEASGGTFNDLYMTIPTTGGNIQVLTSSATTAHILQLPLGGFQFIKLLSSEAQVEARTFSVCGVRG